MIRWTSPLVQRYEEPGAQIAKHIQRLEARIIAHPSIVNNLGQNKQILNDYHPDIIGKEVGERQIRK